MKCLTMGILALSATVTATAALAADYEIFAPTLTGAPSDSNYVRSNSEQLFCVTMRDQRTVGG
jgi:hypothetical protein